MQNLDIVFENESLLVVNKESGLVVNRSETIKEETLQDIIADYLKLPKSSLGIGGRAGIVHRLDRETSGLLLIAKTEKIFENLQSQFRNRKVKKEYIALVHGRTNDSGFVEDKIGRVGRFGKFGIVNNGRESVTYWEKENDYKIAEQKFAEFCSEIYINKGRQRYLKNNAIFYTLVKLFPKTGRTHQIRVHLKHIGFPVVSDIIYCPSKLLSFDLKWCPRLFLHAKSISFSDPISSKPLKFDTDLPSDLKNAMLNLVKL